MKISVGTIWTVILKTIVFTIAVGYISHANMIVFNNNRIAGVPDGHVRVVRPEPSYFDLLFSRYGSIYFNHYGESIRVYIAHYTNGERVLHEQISGMIWGEEHMLSGTLRWGASAGNGLPDEILILLHAGIWSQTRFDFSSIDFEHRLIMNTMFKSGPIERGRRNILALWSSGGFTWTDGNMFEPERLAQHENIAILYVIFD